MTKTTSKPTKATKRKGAARRRKGKTINPFKMRLSAHVTEEGEWISGPPNLTLSRMFLVVLLLHIVIVGGILAFEMLKADPVVVEEEKINPMTKDPNSLNGSSRTLVAGAEYKVRSGDTLTEIADRYDVPTSDLTSLNGLQKGDQIYPGQKLLIPVSGKTIPGHPSSKGTGGLVKPLLKETPGQRSGGKVELNSNGESGTPIGSGTRNEVVPEPAPVQPTQPAAPKTHTVAKGETAYFIANKYNVTLDALKAANGIENVNLIRVGAVLRIP